MNIHSSLRLDVKSLNDLSKVNLEKMVLAVTQGKTVEEFTNDYGIELAVSVRPTPKPNDSGIISSSMLF